MVVSATAGVGDEDGARRHHQWADEDGQQGAGDHQQDEEGGARVDVRPHQAHQQTQH